MIDFPDVGFRVDLVKPRWVECSGYDEEGNAIFFVVEPFDIEISNYDKRVRAMLDILDDPGKRNNKRYNTNQAINLANKCYKAGRHDLYDLLISHKSKRK